MRINRLALLAGILVLGCQGGGGPLLWDLGGDSGTDVGGKDAVQETVSPDNGRPDVVSDPGGPTDPGTYDFGDVPQGGMYWPC